MLDASSKVTMEKPLLEDEAIVSLTVAEIVRVELVAVTLYVTYWPEL